MLLSQNTYSNLGVIFSSQNSSLSIEKIGINVSVLGPHIETQGTTSDPWTVLRKPYFSSNETKILRLWVKWCYVIPSSKDTSVQHTVVFKHQCAIVEEV